MKHFFTLWLPFAIALAVLYFIGVFRWYSPITVFIGCVITQFVCEFYLKEKWTFCSDVRFYEPRWYYYTLNRLRFERLGTTQVGVYDGVGMYDEVVYYYNYWKHENLQSLGIFRVRDILSYYRRFHFQPADISPLVAAGEIKPTGTSVSVDEVIAKIDEQLEKENTE